MEITKCFFFNNYCLYNVQYYISCWVIFKWILARLPATTSFYVSDFSSDTRQSQLWRTPYTTISPKLPPSPNFNSAQDILQTQPYENVPLEGSLNNRERYNPLTAANPNVCYENLNMDCVKKLVGEGYSQDSVIKALGITRNNVDMACDILHEFGTKHG